MQVLMNKKNLDRIFRKNVRSLDRKKEEYLIEQQKKVFQTLKQIKKNNINILQRFKEDNVMESKLKYIGQNDNFNSLTRFKVPVRFSQLAKPKMKSFNFNTINHNTCQRQKQRQISSKRLSLTSRTNNLKHKNDHNFLNTQRSRMNQTISFSNHQNQLLNRNKFLSKNFDNSSEFQRKYHSLKSHNPSTNQSSSDNQTTKNIIQSNKLGTLSTSQILSIKDNQQKRKQIFTSILKGGVMLSNQGAQTEQLRQMCLFLNPQRQKPHVKHNIQNFEQLVFVKQVLDKNGVQKYRKLLNTINQSQQKYDVGPYEEYNQFLLQRNVSNNTNINRMRNKRKTHLYNAEEWR